mgnify:FL=1
MNKKWRYSFLFLLVFTSSFWLLNFYEIEDNEYLKEDDDFKKVINSKDTRAKLITFLKNNTIEFEDFYKDEHYVVKFNSFSVEYDKYGIKIK